MRLFLSVLLVTLALCCSKGEYHFSSDRHQPWRVPFSELGELKWLSCFSLPHPTSKTHALFLSSQHPGSFKNYCRQILSFSLKPLSLSVICVSEARGHGFRFESWFCHLLEPIFNKMLYLSKSFVIVRFDRYHQRSYSSGVRLSLSWV